MSRKICSYCQSEGEADRMYWQSEDGSACMCSECCLLNARATLDILNGSKENEQSGLETKCSYCYTEEEGRIYRHADDGSATMCGNCCIQYARAILEKQEEDNQESEDFDEEEQISSSESDGDVLTNEMVYSWMNGESEHILDIENDAQLIINNNDPSAILQATVAYANYLSDQSGQHEDYIRDLSSRLVEGGGFFENSFIPAYIENQGVSEEEAKEAVLEGMLAVDDLWTYIAFTSTDEQGKMDFAYSYLACLAGDDSYEPPQGVGLGVLRSKMIEAFRNIADD